MRTREKADAAESSSAKRNLATVRVKLLQPEDKSRTLLVTQILSNDPDALYYAASSEDMELPQFIEQMIESFVQQEPSIRVSRSGGTPTEGARAVADALQKTDIREVILDELDRVTDQTALFEFLKALSDALPESVTLVLSARSLNFRMWQPMIEAGMAQVEGAVDGPLVGKVEVFGFGIGKVYSDGQTVTVWDGPLPRSLFFYFTDHPLITRQDIFQTFWPDMMLKDATNVFHVTKRKVSERVGYETMIYSGGFYRQNDDVHLYYDVQEFEKLIARGQQDPDDITAWEGAIHLYRAPFLHRMNMPWIVERRAKLSTDYTEALIVAGRYYEDAEPERALNLFLRAQREAPHREDVYRRTMKLFAGFGQADMVRSQYETLEKRLKAAYNIPPGKTTRELYEQLTR